MTGRSRRRRATGPAVLLAIGILAGSVATLVVQDRRAADAERAANGATREVPDPRSETGAAGPAPREPARSEPSVPPSVVGDEVSGPPTEQVLLAWMVQALPPDLIGTVRALPGIDRVTGVRHGTVGLVGTGDGSGTIVSATAAGAGFAVPIDTIAVDPLDYPSFVATEPATTLLRLGPGDAVLSRTGAQLRGVGPGAVLRFVVAAPGGTAVVPVDLTVAAVVDDAAVGGAELAVGNAAGDRLGLGRERYLLIAHQGDRVLVEEAIRAALGAPVRFRGPGETPFLRDGDAVLPQALVKASFGEFALRPGMPVQQDPAWQDENLVEDAVPVLGQVRCHRAIVEDLRAAMDQIERENLSYLIDTSLACWYADTIEPTGAVSRGLWGLAVVLEPAMNPTGSRSVQDPRVVAIMQAHGFTWGGDFLVAEPAYFEHIGPPVPATP